MDKRLKNEINHGRKIANNAETIWGWTTKIGRIRALKRVNKIIESSKVKRSDHVLEIGCGTGLFTSKIFNLIGCKITAIDISPELLLNAISKNNFVEFKVMDAMNTKFSDDSFDIVYGSSIIHHLEFDKIFKEIYRLLRKGGRCVFAEPNLINPHIFIQKNIPLLKTYLGDNEHEIAVNRFKLKKLLINIGFKSILITPYDFLHPITPRCLIHKVEYVGNKLEKIPIVREFAGSVLIYCEK